MNTVQKHILLAVGGAGAAGLAVIPEAGPVGWRHVAIVAGGALLAGLGVGYAARQEPNGLKPPKPPQKLPE